MRGTTGAAIKSRVATINLVHATNETRPKRCGIFDYPASYANSRLPFEDWKESIRRRSKYCSLVTFSGLFAERSSIPTICLVVSDSE